MPARSDRACPLCGHGAAQTLKALKFRVFDNCPLSGQVDLVACQDCGLCYYRTDSTQDDFDRYYAGHAYYFTTASAGGGGSSPTERRRFAAQTEVLARHVETHERLFDVGCGKGGLLLSLKERGFTRLLGVDPGEACVEHIRDSHGIDAVVGSALDLPTGADMLVYSHVVEHVLDLQRLVTQAVRCLAPGGRVYVEVPDATRYGQQALLPYHELFLEHVNHFSTKTLVHLFAAHGFSVLQTGETHVKTSERAALPCVYAVFQLGGEAVPTQDPDLAAALQRYLHRCAEHPMHERLATLPDEVAVWGVSQHAMLLLGSTALGERRITALVDSDSYKQTKSVMGLPIRPPESLAGEAGTVLVAADSYRDEILSALRDLEFHGSVVTLS